MLDPFMSGSRAAYNQCSCHSPEADRLLLKVRWLGPLFDSVVLGQTTNVLQPFVIRGADVVWYGS